MRTAICGAASGTGAVGLLSMPAVFTPQTPMKSPTPASVPAAPALPPALGEYKGHKLVVLNPSDRFPVQFGLMKARLVVQHFEAIRRFVQSGGTAVS